MAERKPFLLRIDAAVHEGLVRWADDERRSLNAQIEFLLLQALEQRQRPSMHATLPARAPAAREARHGAHEPRRRRPALRNVPDRLRAPTERKVPVAPGRAAGAPAAETAAGETRGAGAPPPRRLDDLWDATVD